MSDRVICGYGSLPAVNFAERARAAAAAGFTEIGYSVLEYQHLKASGMTAAELAAIARREGVSVTELEVLLGFDGDYNPDDLDARRPDWSPLPALKGIGSVDGRTERDMFELAEAFGSRHVVVCSAWGSTPEEATTERFARLCDRAAEVGQLVALEFLPCSTVPDAAVALRIVTEADRANGGICVDAWHHFRGAADDAMLENLPAERIVVIQLSDGPAQPSHPDFFTETTTSRRLLGDGDWNVRGFVDLLRVNHSDAPLSLELLSDELKSGAADTAAQRLADTTRKVLGLANGDAA